MLDLSMMTTYGSRQEAWRAFNALLKQARARLQADPMADIADLREQMILPFKALQAFSVAHLKLMEEQAKRKAEKRAECLEARAAKKAEKKAAPLPKTTGRQKRKWSTERIAEAYETDPKGLWRAMQFAPEPKFRVIREAIPRDPETLMAEMALPPRTRALLRGRLEEEARTKARLAAILGWQERYWDGQASIAWSHSSRDGMAQSAPSPWRQR